MSLLGPVILKFIKREILSAMVRSSAVYLINYMMFFVPMKGLGSYEKLSRKSILLKGMVLKPTWFLESRW